MNFKINYIILLILFFLTARSDASETIYLYKWTFSRTIKIEELNNFKITKKANNKLKNLMKITNINDKDLHTFLSFKIAVPLKSSSRLIM